MSDRHVSARKRWLRHFFVTGAALCVIAACDREDLEPPILSDEASLSPDHRFAAPPAIGTPWLIQVSGDLLWVADAAGDPGLHALRADSGTLVHSLGRRGEGPGDFRESPFDLSAVPVRETGGIWAFDAGLQRITRFQLEDSQYVATDIVSLAGSPRVSRIAVMKDGRVVGVGRSDSARFVIFEPSGEPIASVAGPLLGDSTIPYDQRLSASNGGLRVCDRPDGGGFAIAYYGAGRIEMYDTLAVLLALADVPNPRDAVFERDEDSGEMRFRMPVRHYVDCAHSRRFLYALYSGGVVADIGMDAAAEGRELHVFTLDGRLAHRARLAEPARAISVTPDDDHLFAFSENALVFYRYDLTPVTATVAGPPAR